MQRRKDKGLLLRYVPTPVYYAMKTGQTFTMTVPASSPQSSPGGDKALRRLSRHRVELKRVGPLAKKCRNVVFSVSANGSEAQEQHVSIKDSTAGFEFEGPMASADNADHVPSPMPGQVEKVLVKEGQAVEAGDTLFVVGAMKMEVKTSAPRAGKVGKVEVSVGTRVVEAPCLPPWYKKKEKSGRGREGISPD